MAGVAKSDPVADLDAAARILAKGLRGLSAREQDQVLRFLLKAWLGQRVGYSAQPPGALERTAGEVLELPTFTPAVPSIETSGELQMLPVRIPRDLYGELKAWAGDHGFSMATVVRGLVERFLRSQRER